MIAANSPNAPSAALPQTRRHGKKRLDIQGLRTVAIMAVVAFHITRYDDERQFILNGNLGVDIFFIISGYLMGQILSSKPMNGRNLLDFYMRRIQRIVPIHCVFLVLTFITAQCLLLPADLALIRSEFLIALGFATNYEGMIIGPGLNNSRLSLLHLWSLGVEMQFYLFAPAIIDVIGLLANRTPHRQRNYICLICLTPLTLSSFVAQHFLVTDPAMAFAGLHSRLWQFTFGMMAFFVAELFKKEENVAATHLNMPIEVAPNGGNIITISSTTMENSPKWRLRFLQILSHSIALLLLALLLIVPIRGMLIKIPIVVLSAALLSFHAILDENIQSILLTNSIMVHLGDTSYVLYLVHYPLLQFVKYHFQVVKYGFWDGIAVFVASIVLSELLHWLIDAHLRPIRSRILAIKLIVCLYILCGLVLLPTYFGTRRIASLPIIG